jgi:RHS repeat-associated protein
MRKLLTAKKIWPLILAFFIQTAVSGQAISGNTCVVQGSTETYSYSGPYDGFTYFEWCVTGGVFTGTPYTCVAGGGMATVQITWASNTTSGSVVCYPSNAGSASINVTCVIPVTGGAITAATKTQTLRNNLVPAAINCTPSTGGGCFTTYSYQWQQSTDMSNWTNVSGATGQNLGFSAPLPQTTYFRRRVSETFGGVAYSDIAYKYITTPIGIGGPTCVPAGQAVQYYATGSWTTDMNMQWCVSGGYIQSTGSSCQSGTPLPAVQVVWYNNTAGSISLTTPEEDPGLNVSISIPVIPGSITSGITQNIPYLSKPANIVCSNASGGACSPAYVYQWQQSGNNSTWTDVPASVGTVTGKDLVFAGNFQAELSMYYRRRVTETVSGNVAYSNAAHITIFYPPVIAGPTSCIIPGIPYTYSITGTIGNVTHFNWCAEGGIIVGGGSCLGGAAVTSVQVTWSAGTSNLTCALTSINSSDLVIANVTTLVNNQFVILPASQEVSYGAAFTLYPQQTIGPPCVGVNTFQWQKSTDNTNWTNVSGATGETYTNAENIAQKTWYRRISTGVSGTSHTSNSVYVTLKPFAAGAISASNLLLNYNAAPAITQTPATGGLCLSSAYVYEWQQSVDGGPWQTVGSTAAYPAGAPALIGPTRIRRKVTCGNAVLYTNELSFNINYISANAENLNYIRTNDVLRKGVISWIQADQLPAGQKLQTTVYYDGLGRPAEKVDKQLSPLQYDMVTPMEYDKMGREAKKYLSYRAATQTGKFVSTAVADQNNYLVAGATPFYAGESHAYMQQTYEPSPIGRVTKTMAPGINWAGANRGIGMQYLFNAVADSVRIWSIASTPGALPVSTTRYAAGQLFKNITTDEQNRQVVEYKNKEDQVVLRKVQLAATPGTAHVGWLCTYYVYDDLDNLRFILQPKAVQLINSTFTVTAAIAGELCFRYEYDKRNRQVVRKIPGSGELWLVYDARDRLVMSQDSLLRQQGKWLVTEYDSRNRPVRTGLLTNAANRTVHHDSAYTRIGYPATGGSNYEVLTQTYYDNYAWVAGTGTALSATLDAANTANSAYFITTYNTAPTYAQPVTPSYQTTGLITGSRTKVLGSNPAKYLYTVTFYDDRNRAIQTQRINITGGKDIVTTQYGFTGKVLRTFSQHQKAAPNAQTHNVLTKITYDHTGRLLTASKTVTSTINSKTVSKPEQTVVSHQYDELGQLKTKTLGGTLENLVNDYNIRGWLLGVNRNYVNDAATNYFGFELGYDKAASIIAGTNYTTPQYNGNIGGTIWKSVGDPEKRKYDFTYDNANRLTAADFNQRFGATWAKADPGNAANNIDFSVSGLSYDANGNILSLQQKGWKAGGSGFIDQLTYAYYNSNASNRLLAVTESTAIGTSDYKLGDFTDKNRTADDYVFDGNGNITQDKNRKISGITYNYLNLPQQVSINKDDGTPKGTITYTYDAGGNKLGKTVTDNLNGRTIATLFINDIEYRNDTLVQMGHEEGRLRYAKKYFLNGDSAYQYFYDYFLEDHLGNVRMVLTEQKDTAQYMATMEAAYRAKENKLFYNIAPAYAKALVPGGYPADATTNPNDSLSKLNGSGQKVGPAIILRVMSGDKIDVAVKSFYRPQGSAGTNVNAINDILSALANGIVSVAGDSKGTLAQLNNPTTSPLLGALNSFRSTNNTVPTGKPKAYLNWVLLDERFNYVASYPQSGALVVGNADVLNTLAYTGIPITKNGFLYIYVSNETQNWDVFFDNLSIKHYTGPVQEETHYYPFGLTMAGISSRSYKMATPDCGCGNKELYNGNDLQSKEFSDGSGLELYDFNARTYDPQTGRYLQVDPLPDEGEQESLSTYHFSGNNPVLYNDPDGKCPWCVAFVKGVVQEYATQVVTNLIEGKDLGDALTDVDGGEILKAGVIDAVTLGVGSLIKKGTTVVKLASVAADNVNDANKAIDKAKDVKKLADKADNAAEATKKVPNPYGKKGGPEHQAKVEAAAQKLKEKGYEVTKEVKLSTPAGSTKQARYVDVVATKDGKTVYVNVGKQNKTKAPSGKPDPVSREKKAKDDILNSPDRAPNSKFVYIPYN